MNKTYFLSINVINLCDNNFDKEYFNKIEYNNLVIL